MAGGIADGSRRLNRRSAFPGKERDSRHGSRAEQDREDQRERAATEQPQVAKRTAWKCAHRNRRCRSGRDEQPDHGGISDQAEQAADFQDHEGRVPEIQHDSQSDSREGEDETADILANGVGRARGRKQQQSGEREPEQAQQGDRNAPERAKTAPVDVRARPRRADVADARVAWIAKQMVVDVGRGRRRDQAHQAARNQPGPGTGSHVRPTSNAFHRLELSTTEDTGDTEEETCL